MVLHCHFITLPFLKFYLFFCFLGPCPRHMEVPTLGVESEPQSQQHRIWATSVWDLHHSSRQCWILNPLSEAWDWTLILMDPSWVRQLMSRKENVSLTFFFFKHVSLLALISFTFLLVFLLSLFINTTLQVLQYLEQNTPIENLVIP